MENATAKFPEWVLAEDSFLKHYCEIDIFSWGNRYSWKEGPNSGKFNFIRLLQPNLTWSKIREILQQQGEYFAKYSKSLFVKVSDSVFSDAPNFVKEWQAEGTPLLSILITSSMLKKVSSGHHLCEEYSIRECSEKKDLDLLIDVNASARGWPKHNPIYQQFRSFMLSGRDTRSFILSVDGCAACTASIDIFANKFNLWGLATHKDFQRRGLMNYLNRWLAAKMNKDFYVQVNAGEPSFQYYVNLPGAKLVNTEYKYIIPNELKTWQAQNA